MATPVVDTNGSQKPLHMLVNLKKIQMERDLQALIEKQSHIHSAKLKAIYQSHGRLDNWNYYPQRSLNAGLQRQNLKRISQENGNILERILKRESEYGRWQSEWEKLEHIRANISRYPRHTGLAEVGQHRVTFVDIQCLEEESKSGSSYSSMEKLKNLSHKENHKSVKKPPIITDRMSQFTMVQAKKPMGTLSHGSGKDDRGEESTYISPKRNAASEITDHMHQQRRKSGDQKCSSLKNSSKNIAVATRAISPPKEELEAAASEEGSETERSSASHQQHQDETKSNENYESEKAESEASGSDTERGTSLSYAETEDDDISDTSSHYSEEDSEDHFQSSSSSTEVSETLSNLSLHSKTRSSSKGPGSEMSSVTSGKKVETELSSPRNVSRGSSLEMSSVASGKKIETELSSPRNFSRGSLSIMSSVASRNKIETELSSPRNVRSGASSEMSSVASGKKMETELSSPRNVSRGSDQESKRSMDYDLPEYTNPSPDTSSQMRNKSPETQSFLTKRLPGYSSQASMRAFSRSSASSAYRPESPDDASQNSFKYYESL